MTQDRAGGTVTYEKPRNELGGNDAPSTYEPDEPFLTQSGWVEAWVVGQVAGPSYRVLRYNDGTMRFEHRCDRGERGVVICAPLLQLDNGHRVVSTDPLTIEPSILCGDCGTHGFVRSGRWVAA